MADPRLAKLARLITEYSVALKRGDKVYINGTTAPRRSSWSSRAR